MHLQPFNFFFISSSLLLSSSLLKIPSNSAEVFVVNVLSFKSFHKFLQETYLSSLPSSLLSCCFDNPCKKISFTACNSTWVDLGTLSRASTSSKGWSTPICTATTSSATYSNTSNIKVVVVVIGWVIAIVVIRVVILVIRRKHWGYPLNWPPHNGWSDNTWSDYIWPQNSWSDHSWSDYSGSLYNRSNYFRPHNGRSNNGCVDNRSLPDAVVLFCISVLVLLVQLPQVVEHLDLPKSLPFRSFCSG